MPGYTQVLKPDPKEPLKAKGSLANTSLQVNPSNEICVEAIRKLLLENKPVHETINECQDIRKFLNVRSVTGGAVKSWDRLVPEHSSKEELLSIIGFSEVLKQRGMKHALIGTAKLDHYESKTLHGQENKQELTHGQKERFDNWLASLE